MDTNPKYREGLFGGARGPGKTEASIALMGERCENPNFRGLVLRRNARDLADYESRCEIAYQCMKVLVRRNPMTLRFGDNSQNAKGAVIQGGHLHDAGSYIQYQGQQFSRIGIEELTQIPSELLYKQIMASCRSVFPELFPQMILTANPGGVGMGWVKRRFVEPIDLKNDENYTMTELENGDIYYENDRVEWWQHKYSWETEDDEPRVTVWNEIHDKIENGWRIFVPATIDDNPILTKNDTGYVDMIEGIKTTDTALYNAWRHGDWSVFAGQVFTEFSREKHVINNFADLGTTTEQFNSCLKVISMDWGYSDNTAIYFTAFLDGRPVTYKEIYGNKKLATEWGEELYNYLMASEQKIDYFIYPSDMSDNKNGFSSPIDDIMDWLNKLPPSKQPEVQEMGRENGSRMIRQQVTHKYLQAEPSAKIFKSCSYLVKYLPDLVYDEQKAEEIDTRTDHELTNAYDGWSYGLRWLKEFTEGQVLHKSQRAVEPQRGIVAGQATYADAGISPSDLLRRANKPHRDWKSM